jgi:hypothetical protein
VKVAIARFFWRIFNPIANRLASGAGHRSRRGRSTVFDD